MAIKFKTEEERKIEKEAKSPKTKLEKTQKVFFILAIIAAVVLFIYFTVCLNPVLVIAPLLIFWLMVVIIPSVCTIGLIWVNDGYRNFAKNMTDLLAQSSSSLEKAYEVLAKSLPYVGTFMLLIIVTYGVLSFFSYKNNKENKKFFHHLIASGAMFVVGLVFLIITLVVLNR